MSVKITEGVKMKDGSTKIKVETPFHPNWSTHARNLGGKGSKVNGEWFWYFDPRDLDSVRDLCLDLFGTDGETKSALVDCRVRLTGYLDDKVWFGDREIASRRYRDARVNLGRSTVLVKGEFCSRGGSRSSPRITFDGESVLLEVRDVPLPLAQREAENDPDNVTILTDLPNEPEMVSVEVPADLLRRVCERVGNLSGGQAVPEALEAFLAD